MKGNGRTNQKYSVNDKLRREISLTFDLNPLMAHGLSRINMEDYSREHEEVKAPAAS